MATKNGFLAWVRSLAAFGPALFDALSKRILETGALFEGKIKQPETRTGRLKYTRLMGYVAVLRSAGFGALATALPILLIYFAMVPLFPGLHPDNISFSGWNVVAFYLALIFFSLLATLLELFLLYNDAIRYAGKMNHATARSIDSASEVNLAIETALPQGLTKAALGMVKDRGKKYGINPLEDGSKAGAAARGVAFKANVLVVNALMKQLLRRIFARLFGRAAPRAFVEWLLLPVYVFWNMIGTTKVMNELIARANGPEAVMEIVTQVGWAGGVPEAMRGPAKYAIAHHVKATKSFHPNIEFVLLALGLDDDGLLTTSFEIEHLSGEQRTQLAKFILALPHLEVRQVRVNEVLWPFVLGNIGDEQRNAWQASCKAYINKGTLFDSQ